MPGSEPGLGVPVPNSTEPNTPRGQQGDCYPPPYDDTKWTVMVFMGAATFEGNEPMLEAADSDIHEIESVGSGEGLEIFIQEHGRSPEPRRCHVSRGQFHTVPAEQADPAGGNALEEFIFWALKEARHDPDPRKKHHSLLVLWGHSYDFAFGRERMRSGDIEALDFAELSDVLNRIRNRLNMPDAKLDVIGFDTCDLATVEIAFQMQPFARYLVASQIGIPIPGWPYDTVLMGLRKPFGRPMAPPEFGSWAVRRFCEGTGCDTPVSLTAVDLRRADELGAHAAVLAAALDRVVGNPARRQSLAELFQRSQTDDGRPYVDVSDLCLTLVRESDDPLVREAARALGDFLLAPNPPAGGRSADAGGQPFVLDHGYNAGAAARLHGISLYAPHLVPSRDFERRPVALPEFSVRTAIPLERPGAHARPSRIEPARLARRRHDKRRFATNTERR